MYKKGFTLIELLVVISIISLMSTVILANLNTARVKARDATRLLNIRQVKNALELYYSANGYYPQIGCVSGCDGNGYNAIQLGDPLNPYIKLVPADPSGGAFLYQYVRNPPVYGYGILTYREFIGSYCKTGVNMDPAWWGVPNCPF